MFTENISYETNNYNKKTQMKCNKNKLIIYLKKETQSVNKITISIRLAALNFNFISIKIHKFRMETEWCIKLSV